MTNPGPDGQGPGPRVQAGEPAPILQPGRTCAERVRSDRFKLLVDGQAYFGTLAQSLVAADRQVMLSCWDLDPDILLWRGDDPGPEPRPGPLWRPDAPLPPRLGELLDELCRRNRRLRCRVLTWDVGSIMAVKRHVVPVYHLDWRSHRRVHVRLDGAHPFGASMHVKAVAIDDAVAFVGGFDPSRYRWDRREHLPDDPLRVDPGGHAYPPFHDHQAMLSGPAARAVGGYLRRRWALATRRQVGAPIGIEQDPWPTHLVPDLRQVDVALLRTEPAFEGAPEIREIEAAWLAAVAAARSRIYIENQYITSRAVAEALARRLAEPQGPEVVIVTSLKSTGILEQAVMDGHRERFLATLRRADAHGRLRVYFPEAAPGVPVKVHSKLLIVDDRYLQVGSANLANRSMGLDLELDVGLEAAGSAEARVRAFLAAHREGLLAEHLALPPEEVRAAVARTGSLCGALDLLGAADRPHGLRPLEFSRPAIEVPQLLGDPERNLDLETLSHRLLPDGLPRSLFGHALRLGAGLVLVLALEAVWNGLPVGVTEDPGAMRLWLRAGALEPLPVGALLAAMIGAGLVPFPLSAVVLLAGLAYGPTAGFFLSVVGTGLGALLGWLAGRALGRARIAALGIPRINAISRHLTRGGMVPVAELRLSPRHSFAEVNLVAGAVRISLLDFLPGTVLAGVPSTVVMVGLGHLLARALRRPEPDRVAVALLALLVVGSVLTWLWRQRVFVAPSRGGRGLP